MQQIEQISTQLSQQLIWLEGIISYIFSQIKQCDNELDAQEYFNCLDRIQISLSILVCKDDIGIPDRLYRFMKDFDNFEEAKKNYFTKIKQGSYTF